MRDAFGIELITITTTTTTVTYMKATLLNELMSMALKVATTAANKNNNSIIDFRKLIDNTNKQVCTSVQINKVLIHPQ